MYRLGHASPQAALRYQHATQARDEVMAAAFDAHIGQAMSKPKPKDASI